MARFDTGLFNPQIRANEQRSQNFNDTFQMLMQNEMAKENAEIDAKRKEAAAMQQMQSDPAYILAQAQQGQALSPLQKAQYQVASQKAQRSFIDPTTGQMVTTGGLPALDAQAAEMIASEPNPQKRMAMVEDAKRKQFQQGRGMTPKEMAMQREMEMKQRFEVEKEERGLARQAKKDVAQSKSLLNTLDTLLNDPDLDEISGSVQGEFSSSEMVPAFAKSEAQRRLQPQMDKLKGQQFLQAYQGLRGGGQITEIEGKKAEQAQAALNQTMGDADFREALETYKQVIENGIARKEGKKPPHNLEEEAETATYQEGQTATNPQTGEKLIFKGGSWQKM